MPRALAAFGLVGLAALACGTAAQAAEVLRKGHGIELRGTILAADAARVLALLDKDTHSLRVRSAGGELEAAISIALEVHKRGLPVVVDGLCASACAQFILPAAAWVHVLDGSVIALHAASHGALLAAAREGAMDAAGMGLARRRFEALQARVEAFRAAVQPPAPAWDFMYRLTSPADVQVWTALQNGERSGLLGKAGKEPVCAAWLLDEAGLQAYGVKAPLPWHAPDRQRAAAVLRVPESQIYVGPVLAASEALRASPCSEVGVSGATRRPS